MANRSIQKNSPNKEHYTIHARFLDQALKERSIIDLAGMPKEAIVRTELFVNSLRELTDGNCQLQVSIDGRNSEDPVFSVVLKDLPKDVYDRIWHFFEKLDEDF